MEIGKLDINESIKKTLEKYQAIFPKKQEKEKCVEELQGIYFKTRGIGLDWVDCYLCGKRKKGNGVNHNIAGYIKTKNEGKIIVDWFKQRAWLDYRKNTPKYIQVKIGACDTHLSNLKKLNEMIKKNNYITKKMIKKSKKNESKTKNGEDFKLEKVKEEEMVSVPLYDLDMVMNCIPRYYLEPRMDVSTSISKIQRIMDKKRGEKSGK